MFETVLTGYVRGKDPEMRYTPNGKPVTSFSVPTKVGFGDSAKDVWVRCTAWGKTAEIIAQYVKKGDYVTLRGQIDVKTWDGRDGKTQVSLELTVEKFDFGPKGKEHGDSNGAPAQSAAALPAPVEDEDLPF